MLRGELRAQEGFSLQTRSHNFPKPITSSGRKKQENFKRKYQRCFKKFIDAHLYIPDWPVPSWWRNPVICEGRVSTVVIFDLSEKITKINRLYIVLRSIQKIFAFTFTCDVCLQIFVGKTPRLYLYIILFSCPGRV